MAYREACFEAGLGQAMALPVHAIRLGDAERQVILRARRDAEAHRPGTRLPDMRLEALRLYAMLGRYRRDGARPLLAAGFSPAERRVVDAMLDAMPLRRRSAPATGRLVYGLAILLPLLAAAGAFGWADTYLGDRLIAAVLGGLAALLVLPLASAVTAAPGRPVQPRK